MNMKIQFRRRPQADDSHLPANLSPLLRRLYAMRGVLSEHELETSAKGLLHYKSLNGIKTAVRLLMTALNENWQIIVVGDFDVDGATSTALTLRALNAMGYRYFDYFIPNRLEGGYGLSPQVVEEVIKKKAQLIITVDNGISSYEGVSFAHQNDIKVIITDHHLPGKNLPCAEAIINPNLADCHFPSKALSGVGVSFYLMSALRAALLQAGWFSKTLNKIPNLAELLDLVALGTVADVAPLDKNNRILVYQGLNRIRTGRGCIGIKALIEVSKCNVSRIVANDLGFFIGPLLNAAGRLDDMSIGVEVLLTDNIVYARKLANKLDSLNRTRRKIEQDMQQEALHIFSETEKKYHHIPNGLVLYHPQWHQGVSGILASRIKERFHRPVIVFASVGKGILKGSGRSIHGLHLLDALERLNTLNPGLILTFGGHAMAAGLTLKERKFSQFQEHFSNLITESLDHNTLEAVIWSDGELNNEELSLDMAELIRNAGPWGEAFPEPIFDGKFKLLQQRLVGDNHLKMLLEPLVGGALIEGIAFNIDTTYWPDHSIKIVELVYKLDVNEYRGNRNIQLLIQHFWPSEESIS
ncbi:MAG: single-stranded-DNA-specific exonuclease RecJ [Candidatus Arsenophonus melophagi]|nr:single-stranded-DNA-specific exonuclease RecJ [Candidatus Arsenophonus melophagi]